MSQCIWNVWLASHLCNDTHVSSQWTQWHLKNIGVYLTIYPGSCTFVLQKHRRIYVYIPGVMHQVREPHPYPCAHINNNNQCICVFLRKTSCQSNQCICSFSSITSSIIIKTITQHTIHTYTYEDSTFNGFLMLIYRVTRSLPTTSQTHWRHNRLPCMYIYPKWKLA